MMQRWLFMPKSDLSIRAGVVNIRHKDELVFDSTTFIMRHGRHNDSATVDDSSNANAW
jgi:hypothetical protein